jgi:hypothetical protein
VRCRLELPSGWLRDAADPMAAAGNTNVTFPQSFEPPWGENQLS